MPDTISHTPSCPALRFRLALTYAGRYNTLFCAALRIVAAGSDRSLAVGAPGDTYTKLQQDAGGRWSWVEAVEAVVPEHDNADWRATRHYLATTPL